MATRLVVYDLLHTLERKKWNIASFSCKYAKNGS